MMLAHRQRAVRVFGLDALLTQGTSGAGGHVPFKAIGDFARGLLLQTAALGVLLSGWTNRLALLNVDLELLGSKTPFIIVWGGQRRADQLPALLRRLHQLPGGYIGRVHVLNGRLLQAHRLLLPFHLHRTFLVALQRRMGHDAADEIARRLARSQDRFAHRLGHLHFVAHMLLLLLALAFGAVGRVGIVRVLHMLRTELFLGFGLGRFGAGQDLKLFRKDPGQQGRLLFLRPLLGLRGGQPGQQLLRVGPRFHHLAHQRFQRSSVIGLAFHITLPQKRPPCGARCLLDFFGQFGQSQTQALTHAIQAAHAADPPEHLGGIQTLAALPGHQSGLHQRLQHHLKANRAQAVTQQALAEINQRGGMEQLISHLSV